MPRRVAHIAAVKGLGPWTAEIHLLFAEQRPDVFPRGDIALAASAAHLLGLEARPGPKALAALALALGALAVAGGAAAVAPLALRDGAAGGGGWLKQRCSLPPDGHRRGQPEGRASGDAARPVAGEALHRALPRLEHHRTALRRPAAAERPEAQARCPTPTPLPPPRPKPKLPKPSPMLG